MTGFEILLRAKGIDVYDDEIFKKRLLEQLIVEVLDYNGNMPKYFKVYDVGYSASQVSSLIEKLEIGKVKEVKIIRFGTRRTEATVTLK